MLRWKLFFVFFISVGAFAQQKNEGIRILNLLPYVVRPPLVNPYIPQDFILGERAGDPYFSKGYYWGSEGSLTDYFEDPTTLKGCLIRSQVATTVTQQGFDRFSNDGQVNDLTAAGFTEIKIKRGKWGIFPYRELVAKGPRGRKYYQMWVGLNTQEGAALCFQFIYPEYLNEPTQHQKQIWENFVNRTSLLDMDDLLVASGTQVSPEICQGTELSEKFRFIAEKRRFDQKIFIQIKTSPSFNAKNAKVEVLDVKEIPSPVLCIKSFFGNLTHPSLPFRSLKSSFCHTVVDFEREELSKNLGENLSKNFLYKVVDGTNLAKPYLEVHAILEEDKVFSEKIQTSYEIVDQFSFSPKMLSLSRFTESDHYLFFQ